MKKKNIKGSNNPTSILKLFLDNNGNDNTLTT